MLKAKGTARLPLEKDMRKNLGMKVSSLTDLVTAQIRDYIITGEFKPGQQLKEEELCEVFGISRPPIREAFKTLEAIGLVVRRPRKGVIVAEFTVVDVEEVYTVISLLYQKATDMAMRVMTDKDLEQLASHVERMATAIEAQPIKLLDYQAAHIAFHQLFMDLAGNERMKMIEKQLRYQISIFSYKSFQDQKHLISSLNYHRCIYEAICAKNRGQAMALVEEHIISAIEYLKKYFDK